LDSLIAADIASAAIAFFCTPVPRLVISITETPIAPPRPERPAGGLRLTGG
jgi:hypothetical protein